MCKFWQKNNILLVTTAPPFLPLIGYLAHKLLRLPYVCLIYDLYPDAVTELQVLPARHILVRWWNAINLRVWRSAQSIIVLSSTMKKRIIAKHPQVAEKISVIHNWADPHWIKPIAKQDSWFTHKYELTDKFTVLYSGNLGRCHEINTIVEAARLLQGEPIQFVFIGGGVNRSACIKLVESLGLNNCLFLPYQDKQNLPYSLTACDLALVTIAHGLEGVVAPSKLYGILAAGRPVVAVCEPHSYLRQLLTKAKCGAVFQHNDSINLANFIRFLALNPDLAKKMGQAGRNYLEKHFTPEIIAEQYLQVLRRVKTEAKQENYTTIQEGNVATANYDGL
jgi:glycosyltransferase involved in cell wall biosynthesis